MSALRQSFRSVSSEVADLKARHRSIAINKCSTASKKKKYCKFEDKPEPVKSQQQISIASPRNVQIGGSLRYVVLSLRNQLFDHRFCRSGFSWASGSMQIRIRAGKYIINMIKSCYFMILTAMFSMHVALYNEHFLINSGWQMR